MIELHRDVPVPMRDGAVLRADVWRNPSRPAGPTVLVRTPYLKELTTPSVQVDPRLAADRGYTVVVQDVRGRGTSDGTFEPFVNERVDGADTIAWLRAQPWSDGRVVMLGMSYVGATQWLAADALPEGLVAIGPTLSSPAYGEGWSFTGGVREHGFLATWNAAGLARPEDGWFDEPARAYTDLDGLAAITPWAREWFSEPAGSEYWTRRGISDPRTRRAVPALIVAGWYDVFCTASIRSFLDGAHPDDRLVIGPWGHEEELSHLVGEADLGWSGEARNWGFAGRALDYFDAILAGEPPPQPRVQAYVLGAKQWLSADQWPPAGTATSRIRLTPGGFTVDPDDPTPALGGRGLLVSIPGFGFGVRDQRPLAARSDVATILDHPVGEPLLLSGPVAAQLQVSAATAGEPERDHPQWVVVLCVRRRDGRLDNLCEGVATASVTADRVRVELGHVAVVIEPGEALVMLATGAAWPRWERPAAPAIQQIHPGSTVELPAAPVSLLQQ